MALIDLNKVEDYFTKIREEFGFNETLELVRMLITLLEVKHRNVLNNLHNQLPNSEDERPQAVCLDYLLH